MPRRQIARVQLSSMSFRDETSVSFSFALRDADDVVLGQANALGYFGPQESMPTDAGVFPIPAAVVKNLHSYWSMLEALVLDSVYGTDE